MKTAIVTCFLALVLSACAPSQTAIQTAIASTNAALPTLTPTPTITPTSTPEKTPTPSVTPIPTKIPLNAINLELFTAAGEKYLPTGFSNGQFRSSLPDMFKNVPATINQAYQQFEKNGETKGGLSILIYDTVEDANNAFDAIYDDFGDTASQDESNGIHLGVIKIPFIGGYDVVMQKCIGIYQVRATEVNDLDAVISYLGKVTAPLHVLVCQNE
jgi:hypothetical protein